MPGKDEPGGRAAVSQQQPHRRARRGPRGEHPILIDRISSPQRSSHTPYPSSRPLHQGEKRRVAAAESALSKLGVGHGGGTEKNSGRGASGDGGAVRLCPYKSNHNQDTGSAPFSSWSLTRAWRTQAVARGLRFRSMPRFRPTLVTRNPSA